MYSFIEDGLGFDLNWIAYSIIKLDGNGNGIGERGFRQLKKCLWQNLSRIDLGILSIIEVLIKLETLAASGWASLNGNSLNNYGLAFLCSFRKE